MTHADRRLWWSCSIAGVATFALSFWFRMVSPAGGCGGSLEGKPPLLAFQFARSPEDLLRVFGPAGSECRTGMVLTIDRMNMIDLFLFIPAYGLFLMLFILAIAGRPRTHLARAAGAALIIAVVLDAVETATQLAMTEQLDRVADFWVLAVASVGKFLMLGLTGVLAGLLAWRHRHRIASGAMVVGGVTALAVLALGLIPMIAIGLALAWIAALATAIRMSVANGRSLPAPSSADV